MYVVSDSIFLLQHCLVAELRVFWCELTLLRLTGVSLLRDIFQVNHWESLLNIALPATGHLLHRELKFEVVDYLQSISLIGGHALGWASR